MHCILGSADVISHEVGVDPIIANPLDAQTHNPYSYVRNRPLVMTDPSGFTEQEAWRLWSYDTTPGQIGVHVAFNQLTPPAARPIGQASSNAPPAPSTADYAPSAPEAVGPGIPTPAAQIMVGMGILPATKLATISHNALLP